MNKRLAQPDDTAAVEHVSRYGYDCLMQRRIKKILLICSSYDGYILEEDGRIESQINREYIDLNMSNPPSFTRVNSTAEALEVLREDGGFDFILTLYNVGSMDVFTFGRIVKRDYPHIPVILLTNYSKDMYRRMEEQDRSGIDHIFCWHGNADLIIAIIKIVEDEMNADNDILGYGVQGILLVEDSIRYYSTYLPAIYKLILQQNSEFLKDALNEQQQIARKRARPKILLATNYTDAVALYEKYKENLLGVISDVGFVIDKNDRSENEKSDAGIDLCRLIKKDNPLMPFVLQSSQESMRRCAEELGVGFFLKYSKTLLFDLSEYISQEFAFGDFVFKNRATGAIITRVKDLRQMQQAVTEVPDDELLWHASQNRFSKWFYSRGLFSLAETMKGMSPESFSSLDEMRTFIADQIKDYRMELGYGVVAKFDPETYNETIWFARIGEGSLGGKARGLAFINSTLQKYDMYNRYDNMRVIIPRTVVVATDYFDQFIKENGLQYVINSEISDDELLSEFVSSRLPEKLVGELRTYIKYARRPLAVRSSSKLEDSHYQPFAGIYSTYMIPSVDNEDQMLRLLGKAIKSVYASVFFAASRAYIATTSNLLSEEKMAVIIQEICGSQDNGYYFPTISGVARSLNYYPLGDEKPEDGIVNMAFGLGKLVVDGGQALRFSPKYPKKILQLSTPELALRDTQKEMYALSLRPEEFKTSIDDAVNIRKFSIYEASRFTNIRNVASTWDVESMRISDSPFDEGRKIITFANILKYDALPIARILCDMLSMGEKEMMCPVEIEFAVEVNMFKRMPSIFSLLQIRPIIDNQGTVSLDWSRVETDDALIYAQSALGTGQMENISDIVYVKTENFDPKNTELIAEEIREVNARMKEQRRNYVLIGPGRWGSSDPWLGIPVKWQHISEAGVIVECGLKNFRVEPSQGTHFFQNLTSLGVGYLTINPFEGDGRLDTARLDAMEAEYDSEFVRVVHAARPLYIFVDGRNGKAVVRETEA